MFSGRQKKTSWNEVWIVKQNNKIIFHQENDPPRRYLPRRKQRDLKNNLFLEYSPNSHSLIFIYSQIYRILWLEKILNQRKRRKVKSTIDELLKSTFQNRMSGMEGIHWKKHRTKCIELKGRYIKLKWVAV